MRVFVLLFNAGTENEGIHTLKVNDRNVILMFESEDDATRYGLMLEAQDFSCPSIEAFESEEIEGFCQEAGYECKLVPEGTLAMPPETNVEKTDWQIDADRSTSPQAEEKVEEKSEEKSDLSQFELDEIRRRLEGLL